MNRIKHGPIIYHGKIEEFPAELNVSIEYSEDEITVGFEHFDESGEKTYLKTNAFVFKDSGKAYYFKTHQIIRVVNREYRHLLGTSVDLDLTLTRASAVNDYGSEHREDYIKEVDMIIEKYYDTLKRLADE